MIPNSQKFYLVSGLACISGMAATSILFADGVRDLVANVKLKNRKGVFKSLLKIAPFILCTTGAILSAVGGYHFAAKGMTEAAKAISNLSSAAGVTGIGSAFAEKAVDKTAEAVENINKEPEPKKSAEDDPDEKIIELVDSLSGQHFMDSIFHVNQAVNDFNTRLISTMEFMTVNDWYYYINLRDTVMGDRLGFQIDPNGNGQLRISFQPRIEKDKPVTYIVYRVEPKAENTRAY